MTLTGATTSTAVTGVVRQLVDDLQLPLYNGRLLLLTLATQAGRCVSVWAWEGGWGFVLLSVQLHLHLQKRRPFDVP
jgi:hypothetical protein